MPSGNTRTTTLSPLTLANKEGKKWKGLTSIRNMLRGNMLLQTFASRESGLRSAIPSLALEEGGATLWVGSAAGDGARSQSARGGGWLGGRGCIGRCVIGGVVR